MLIGSIIILSIIVIVESIYLFKRRKQVLSLNSLVTISKKLASNLYLNNLVQDVMEITKAQVNCEACTLYIVDKENNELWFEVALGEKGEELKEIRLPIGDGSIAGWVAKHAEVVNVKDANADPRFMKSISKKIQQEQKAILTIPVKLRDDVIGVLQVINKLGGDVFSKKDEETLKDVAGVLAVAIENIRLYQNLAITFKECVSALAGAIDAKDNYTQGHSKRVSDYCVLIGREMGYSENQLQHLEMMGALHDVGKISIPDSILNKQSRLSEAEFEIMKTHTQAGFKILSNTVSLKDFAQGALYHHEKFDGTGYVKGLKGEEIPIEARIIAVADSFDAMTSNRPYSSSKAINFAIEQIGLGSGTHFDPQVVDCFVTAMRKRGVDD